MAKSEPIDEAYFVWLCAQVVPVELKNRNQTYWKLLRILHNKEFTWDPNRIDKDGNRAQDGKDLRQQFLRETGTKVTDRDRDWLQFGCSFLELFVVLSWQLEFDGGQTQHYWFNVLLQNLTIHEFVDTNPPAEGVINHILDIVIDRSYTPTGAGGLFPLENPREDQREVELWYQLNAYLLERL